MSEELEELQEEVITIKKDDLDFLKKCITHFKEIADSKEQEVEDLKKQLNPQSLDTEFRELDLESLKDILGVEEDNNDLHDYGQ